MESQWSGSISGAFYSPDQFDRCRIMERPLWKPSGKSTNAFYVLGVDVGRVSCSTEVVVLRVRPTAKSTEKDVVNIFTLEDTHFGSQALQIKKIFEEYKCEACVLDGNGLIV